MHQPRAERLHPAIVDPAVLSRWGRIRTTVQAAESGEQTRPVDRTADRLRVMLHAGGQRLWGGWLGTELVGTAEVRPDVSTPDAVTSAFVRLYVAPDHRRRGVGRALAAALAEDQLATGVHTLQTIVRVGTDGERFAVRRGARVLDALVIDALDLGTADRDRLAKLAEGVDGADGAEPALTLRSWCGRAPEDLVDSYAAAKQSIADAPNAAAPEVPEWDRALVREREESYLRRAQPLWVAAAVQSDAGTDRIVAFTEIGVPDRPPGSAPVAVDASQEDTVVLESHRRHGVATRVKAFLIAQLIAERPDVVRISSTTAVTNLAMRRVNERLGFRELARRNLVQLDTRRLR